MMVGHVTLLIQFAGRNILTDPVWSERASPVRFRAPPRRAAGDYCDALPPVDLILLGHNHCDHLPAHAPAHRSSRRWATTRCCAGKFPASPPAATTGKPRCRSATRCFISTAAPLVRPRHARHGRFRLATLPIGADEPRWFMTPRHQNPAEAVAGLRTIDTEAAIGHHRGHLPADERGAPRGA